MTQDLQSAKALVDRFNAVRDAALPGVETVAVCHAYLSADHAYRGMRPFYDIAGPEALADTVWSPLKSAMSAIQRRPDIFFASHADLDPGAGTWVVEMGNFLCDFTADWLGIQLQLGQARVDLPLLVRCLAAANAGDAEALAQWNDYTLACRETAELRLADTAMGEALVRLLKHLSVPMALEAEEISFVACFAMASSHYGLEARVALHGYTWAWLENQVAAATKLVPLGQSAAQALLGDLLEQVPAALDTALELTDEQIGASLPGLAMVSCWHESQYSRLFRS